MTEPVIDDPTADRILLGAVLPDDAPPGYGGLAALAKHATEPAAASEVARETLVLESMLAVRSPSLMRAVVTRRRLTARFATLALLGTFGLGSAVAAAAGALPGQSHGSFRPSRPPISTAGSTDEPGTPATTAGSGGDTAGHPGTRPVGTTEGDGPEDPVTNTVTGPETANDPEGGPEVSTPPTTPVDENPSSATESGSPATTNASEPTPGAP